MTTSPTAAAIAAAGVPGLRIINVKGAFYWQLRRRGRIVGLGRYPLVSAEAARMAAHEVIATGTAPAKLRRLCGKLPIGADPQLGILFAGATLARQALIAAGERDSSALPDPRGYMPQVIAHAARVTAKAHSPLPEAFSAASCTKTLLEVGHEYLTWFARSGRRGRAAAESTLVKTQWLFKLLAPLHSRPVGEITRREVSQLLEELESGGHCDTTHRVARLAVDILARAADKGYIAVNPIESGFKSLATKPTVHRPAITDPMRFGELLAFCSAYRMVCLGRYRNVAAALHLAPLVFVRPAELRMAEWSEFDFDKALWTIPATKMKMRRELQVPLARQAVAILQHQRKLTGHQRYVFSQPGKDKPISENALNSALRAFCSTATEHCAHGFRSSTATLLREQLKIDSELVEIQLGHVNKDRVAAIYQRVNHTAERATMMQRWADWCDGAAVKAFATLADRAPAAPSQPAKGIALPGLAGLKRALDDGSVDTSHSEHDEQAVEWVQPACGGAR